MAKKNNDSTYQPSGFANFLSKIAAMLVVGGVFVLFADGGFDPDNLPATIIIVAMGVGLFLLADNVRYNHLFKFYREHGYEEQFKTSRELCVKIYNANPTKRILKYIMKLNPEAGKSIAEQLAAAKKK